MLNRILKAFSPTSNSGKTVQHVQQIFDAVNIGSSSRDTTDTTSAYTNAMVNGWWYSVIRLLADRLSSNKILPELGEDTVEGFEPVDFDLFERTNGLMSFNFSLRYMWWWYFLRGNAYYLIETPNVGAGEVLALYPLISGKVTPLPATLREGVGVFKGVPVIDYEYTADGQITKLPGENIIHLRTPNPFDYWQGLSPLSAAISAIDNDNSISNWQTGFFDQDNGIPSAIIALDKDIDEYDFRSQVQQISQQLDAGKKRLFTRSGDLKVEVLSQTIQQMQVTESRALSQKEIYAVYGVPMSLFDLGSSGEAVQAAEIMLARNTIQPAVDMLANQLTVDLAPYYGQDLFFKAPNIIPQDRALEVQEHTIYAPFRSLNETRNLLGLAAVELDSEFSDLQAKADIPLQLLKLQEQSFSAILDRDTGSLIGSQDPEQATATEAQKSTDSSQLLKELKQWRKRAKRLLGEKKNLFIFDHIPQHQHQALHNIEIKADTPEDIDLAYTWFHSVLQDSTKTDANLDPNDIDAEDELLRDTENRNTLTIEEAFREAADELTRATGIRWTEQHLLNDLDGIFYNNPTIASALEEVMDRSSDLGTRIAIDQLEQLNITADYRQAFTNASEWARQNAAQEVTNIDATTQQMIREQVAEYFSRDQRGQAQEELAELLLNNIHGLSPERARLIAITESTRAAAEGHLQAYEQVEDSIREVKWFTVSDRRVCFLPFTSVDGKYITKYNTGDKVNTRSGQQKVILPTKSKYKDKICVVFVEGISPIFCTKDHLFYTQNGWVEAQNLHSLDVVYGLENQPFNVIRVEHILFTNAYNSIPHLFKVFCLFAISQFSSFCRMPVGRVNL